MIIIYHTTGDGDKNITCPHISDKGTIPAKIAIDGDDLKIHDDNTNDGGDDKSDEDGVIMRRRRRERTKARSKAGKRKER